LSGDGSTVLIGADRSGSGGATLGSGYVFVQSGGTWSYQQKLTASDAAPFDNFGVSVALSHNGNVAIVGATSHHLRQPNGAPFEASATYLFTRSAGTWIEQQEITSAASYLFGISVALSGDGNTALVGASQAAGGSGFTQGAAYVFTTPTITPTATSVPAVRCMPRPTVLVQSVRESPGTLRVMLTASDLPATTGNRITSVAFDRLDNASVSVAGGPQTQTQPFSFTTQAPEPVSLGFTVTRLAVGQASTVTLRVFDACGPWSTFVGSGPNAF
jgi:hypothetical protein